MEAGRAVHCGQAQIEVGILVAYWDVGGSLVEEPSPRVMGVVAVVLEVDGQTHRGVEGGTRTRVDFGDGARQILRHGA